MTEGSSAPPETKDRFFRDIVTVVGFGSAFAAIPLFASMENLQPPWPSSIAYVSSAVILVATLLAWEFGPGLSRRQRRSMLLLAAALTVTGLFGYLYLYSNFVVSISGGRRIIVGYQCNNLTQAVYPELCPYLGAEELRRASNNPEMLFTRNSLTNVRLALVAAWFVFVAGLMAAVAWSVAGRRRAVAAADNS